MLHGRAQRSFVVDVHDVLALTASRFFLVRRYIREQEKLQRDRAVSPPLSWLLSDLARDWMDRSLVRDSGPPSDCVQRNASQLDTIAAALRSGTTRTP